MSLTAHRYERSGVLAIDPSAFFELFMMRDRAARENEAHDEATVVTIRGPLDQHDQGWCDSYESIVKRVAAACAEQPPAVVLKIDSPGGDAAGCFDCAREVRALCERAGKQLVAFVDGKAASAAYAIGCVASRVVMSDVAQVGSIGILATRPDYSVANAARGYRLGFVTSGARKIDGHPDTPITEGELAATQRTIDSMAVLFFEHVGAMRGIGAAAVAALEAGVFHGDAARKARLGDESMSFKATLASLASWRAQSQLTEDASMAGEDDTKKKPEGEGDEGGGDFESIRTSLKNMAKGKDANAARAKKALATLEGADEEAAPAAEGGTPETGAEGAGDEPDAEEKKDEPAAAAARAMREAIKARGEVDKLKAELAQEKAEAKRERLIAGRPDLSKEMRALLAKSPLSLVEETLKENPAPEGSKGKGKGGGVTAGEALAALQPGAAGTRGESQRDGGASALPPDEKAVLDRRFGLRDDGKPKAGNVDASSPFKLSLGGTVHSPLVKPEPPPPNAA